MQGLAIGAVTGGVLGATSNSLNIESVGSSKSDSIFKTFKEVASKATFGLSDKYSDELISLGKAVYTTISKLADTPSKPESRRRYSDDKNGGSSQGEQPKFFIRSNSQTSDDSYSINQDMDGDDEKRKRNGLLNSPIRPYAANIAYMSFFSKQLA